MKRYTESDLKKINSIGLGKISKELYPELEKYNVIITYISNKVLLFDNLTLGSRSANKRNEQSLKFMRKLLRVLNRIPDEVVEKISYETMSELVIFCRYPNISDIEEFETIFFPHEYETKKPHKYIEYFGKFINNWVYYRKQDLPIDMNNLSVFTRKVYDAFDDKFTVFHSNDTRLLLLLICYLYTHQEEYDIEDLSDILRTYMDKIDYYRDLFTMNTGLNRLVFNEEDPKLLGYYFHLDHIIHSDYPKTLCKTQGEKEHYEIH